MPHIKRFWQRFTHFQEAETAWDEGKAQAEKENPLKILKHSPDMVGIAPESAPFLKLKSLKYLITEDNRKIFPRLIFKHPFKYFFSFLRSILKKKSYERSGDLFFYGINNLEAFEKKLQEKEALFVIGFSYCHKPFECPSGRFSKDCVHDPDHAVCRQCFIGKAMNALPEKGVIPLVIPTIHYIGEKILKIKENYPKRKIYFLITACEMTLEMFGDWGNMAGIQGIGIRLGGRICNTLKAFELSEKGIKPGLTTVAAPTEALLMALLKKLYPLYNDTTCETASEKAPCQKV